MFILQSYNSDGDKTLRCPSTEEFSNKLWPAKL